MNKSPNHKMKILIVAYWHDPRFKKKPGGLIRIFELADNLTIKGNRVVLILPKLGYPKTQTIARVIEIPFIDFPLVRPLSFHLISGLVLLIKMIERVDFLYVRQMNSFLPLIIARLFKIPTFFEIPNDPYLAYQSSARARRFFERLIDQYSMVLAHRIVVLSEWSKRRLNQLGGISLSKIIVSPSGTDTKLFKPLEKRKCCKTLGLDPSLFYVGFVGSFFDHQGIETLINAAPIILGKLKNVWFLLVGDGPMMDIWKDKIKQKGLQHAFIFTGQVPYKKVPEYVGAMDICVAPHKKDTNQASPVKLFDYMACGKPIVASDIEVVREIVGDSGCLLLTKPENKLELAEGIISLIQDEGRRKIMGQKGREIAIQNYDREKIVKDLIARIK
jgi:glycosyltransferase involved in cell wall biosynthesis